MSRSDPALEPPDPSRVNRTFPSTVGAAGTVVHRATGEKSPGTPYGPGWFDSSIDGRFNLTPGAQVDRSRGARGTLYVSLHPRSAVLEKLKGLGRAEEIPWALALRIHLWQLRVSRSIALADLHSIEAENRGVTQDLTHGEDYPLTQQWAAAFDQAGLGGIRYQARFTMSLAADRLSWAVFGPAGEGFGPFEDTTVGPVVLPLIASICELKIGPPSRLRPPPPTAP